MPHNPVARTISEKLTAAFEPENLRVIDESAKHAGHAGARPEGETHFRVEITAAAFTGKSLIQRHRMVNAALAHELQTRVHALAISAKAPGR